MWKHLILAGLVVCVALAAWLWIARVDAPAPDVAAPCVVSQLPAVETIVDDGETESSPVPASAPAAPAATGDAAVSGVARMHGAGEPAPGVTVSIRVQHTGRVFRSVTGDDGSYTVLVPEEEVPAEGVWALTDCRAPSGWRAQIPDHPGIGLRRGQAITGVDLVVAKNMGAISGTVYAMRRTWLPEKVPAVFQERQALVKAASEGKDRQNGRDPLEAMLRVEKQPCSGITVRLSAEITTQSDEQGRYEFTGVPPGKHTVTAVAPQEAAQVTDGTNDRASTTVDVDAEACTGVDLDVDFDAVTVTGRVVDRDGRPIARAAVRAEPLAIMDGDGEAYVFTKAVETVSGDDGSFALMGLVPPPIFDASAYLRDAGHCPRRGSTYSIFAEAPGYARAYVVVPAVTAELAKVAAECFRMFLTVIPQPDAEQPFPDPALKLPSGDARTITDVEIMLDAAAVVAGRVVDTAGELLRNGQIHMIWPDDQRPTPGAFERGANAPEWIDVGRDGTFLFADVASGIYLFEVDSGLSPQLARNEPLRVLPGTTYADVQVVVESRSERGAIEGQIMVPEGAKVPENWLRVSDVVSPNEPSPRFGEVFIDPVTGIYRIDGISAGTVTLEGQAEGYPRVHVEIEVAAGRVTRHDIELVAEGILRGTVTRNGEPSVDGNVTLPGVEGAPGGTTHARGEYEVKNIAPGTYVVQYSMWALSDEQIVAKINEEAVVEIASGRETRLDIAYEGHGTIRGEFVGPEDAKWFVRVEDERLRSDEKSRAYTVLLQGNGGYEIPGLAAGTYMVVGECRTGEEEPIRKSESVVLGEGGDVQVDFDFGESEGDPGSGVP